MKKTMITLVMAALMPWGMAWAFHDGGTGGGERGGAGGWGGGSGGNSGGNSNSNSWNDHSKPKDDSGFQSSSPRSSGRSWSQGRNSARFRSNGNNFRNYGRNNGSYRAGNGFHHFNSSNSQSYARYGSANRGFHSNTISPSLRQMGVTRVPNALSDRAMLPNSFRHSSPALPTTGPSGKPFSGSIASPRSMSSPQVRGQMAAITGNKTFMAKVAATTPTLRNQYIWHSYNGVSYATYWSGHGGCWYGWRFGGGFFWTQFYGGNWWWYDPWWGNWCWWSGGNWWWQNPATTTVYIYENGSYTAANNGNDGNAGYSQSNDQASSQPPDGQDYSDQKVVGDDQTAASALAEGGNTLVYHSQDGSHTVKLSAGGDAFLYDDSGSPNFLDSNVASVKFSKPGEGPLRILLILKDGSFEIFNADGTPANGTKA